MLCVYLYYSSPIDRTHDVLLRLSYSFKYRWRLFELCHLCTSHTQVLLTFAVLDFACDPVPSSAAVRLHHLSSRSDAHAFVRSSFFR